MLVLRGWLGHASDERAHRLTGACRRSPPSAGNDSTAVRRCGSVWARRYRRLSSSRSGSSVSPMTRSHSCRRAWSRSRANAVSTSSEPTVNGSLTTSRSQASRSSRPGGPRSLIRRAIELGEAGSATSPTWIAFIPVGCAQRTRCWSGASYACAWSSTLLLPNFDRCRARALWEVCLLISIAT